MNGILDVAVEDADGVSSKKWALRLIAFVAGGAVVLWLVRRRRGSGPSTNAGSEAPASEDRGAANCQPFRAASVRNG